MNNDSHTKILIMMGVSGCGKSTVGRTLAQEPGWTFYDGDDFHPGVNIAKMSNGIPLTDEDRMPWLDNIHDLIEKHIQAGESAIIDCSALKRSYQKHLKQSDNHVILVHLHGEFDLIWSRMSSRENHFMKSDMLKSQFDTLEPPDSGEPYVVDINQPENKIIAEIKATIV